MGLDDRDYMRDVPIYRDLVHGGSNIPPSHEVGSTPFPPVFPPRQPRASASGTRQWAWFGLGVVAALALIAFAASHRHEASTQLAALPDTVVPIQARQTIAGPDHALVGSVLTLHGALQPSYVGAVSVDGRWSGGFWTALASTQATNGHYELRVNLDRRGVIDLRLNLPYGQVATKTITVT